jgi:mRNA-degrading endonuclease toxin of MazEF toxin-antitoxin module
VNGDTSGVVRLVGLTPMTGKQRESAQMAVALSRKVGNNYYQGTVPYAEVQRRRRKAKAARVARRAQRRAASR